jgi:GDP-D-mannose dehydratase
MTRRALITGISGQDGSYLADDLCADPRRARYELGWKPEVDFPALVRMMVQADLRALASSPVPSRGRSIASLSSRWRLANR